MKEAERGEAQDGKTRRTRAAQSREAPAHTDEQAEVQRLRRLVKELRAITVTVDGNKVPAADLPLLLQVEDLHARAEQATITVGDSNREVSGAPGGSAAGEQDAQELIGQLQVALDQERMQRERLAAALKGLEVDLQQARSRSGKSQAIVRQDVIETLSEHQRFLWRLLVRTLVQLDGTAAAIAKLLFMYDGREQTSSELAGHLHKATSTINQNIPTGLIRDSLVTCSRRGNAYLYSGRLMDYLRAEFPGKEKALLAHIFVLLS
ncbi:MAG: hypothetical protein ACJ8BW_23560 [Ktedonobacteraceae bacterium]